MSNPTVDIELDLPFTEPHHAVAAQVVEGISKISHAQVEISTPKTLVLSSALLSDVTLRISLDGAPARSWAFRLGGARFLGNAEGAFRYQIVLRPRLWLLEHTKNTRKFRNMTAQEIVSSVLSEGGVPFVWRTTRTPPRRKYCIQYRESNLAFVLRLLEFEGVYYTFTTDDVLELGDSSTSADFVDGDQHYELIDASGALGRARLGIHAWKKSVRVASGKVSVNDFNWKKPRLGLLTSEEAAIDAELETYDFPTGFRNPKDGAYLARIRLDAQRVQARTAEGKSNVPWFAPLRKLSFGANGGPAFAGEYLLIEVEHRAHVLRYQSVLSTLSMGHTYENELRAIPSTVPFRPAWQTPRPTIEGCHTAIVRGPTGTEIHTDKYGRFRGQFHWDRDAKGTDEDSRWIRPLQETATSMVLARVGWEMSIAYVDGDPDRPVGMARNINGIMVPTYAQPANKSMMTIKTPTSPKSGGYNEIRLEDKAGEQSFYLRAERDFIGVVKRDRTERIGANQSHFVTVQMNHTVEHDQGVLIGANSTTRNGHDQRFGVKGNRSITVGGNENIEVGATSASSVFGNDAETVGSTRTTLAGLAGNGSINRRTEANLVRAVGGAFLTLARENVQTLIQQNYLHMVGGIKLTVTKQGSISKIVSGEKQLTVGGAVIRSSGDDMGIGTEKSIVMVGGSAHLTSAERIEYRGKSITLETKTGMKFEAPGLELSLVPGKASIAGKVLLKAGEKVMTTGGPNNITK
jgi:type VI secretion system secreted protein VgrG